MRYGPRLEFGNIVCRRYTPKPIIVGEDEKGRPLMSGYLLPVNHNWWCGEWKAK